MQISGCTGEIMRYIISFFLLSFLGFMLIGCSTLQNLTAASASPDKFKTLAIADAERARAIFNSPIGTSSGNIVGTTCMDRILAIANLIKSNTSGTDNAIFTDIAIADAVKRSGVIDDCRAYASTLLPGLF